MRPLLFCMALAALAACKGSGDDSSSEGAETGAPDAGRDTSHATPPPTATVDCAIDSDSELEPNDTPETANTFTTLAFCGVISPATDIDYASFTTPDGTKLGSFQAVINGKVDFDITLNGKTFKPGDSENYGAGTYLVKAFSLDGKTGSYRMRLRFDAM